MSHDSLLESGRTVEESERLQERARDLIPGGSQTGSKKPANVVQGVSPTYLERADGCRVWDPDGNEYIDYRMSLGPILLGYNYPDVKRAVDEQHEDGPVFSLPHELQVDVAELLVDVVPSAEKVRFAKNGNDATTLAAKVARAHTGRDVVATTGYHGWPDVWMSNTRGNRGIPKAVGAYTEGFEYDDVESLEDVFEKHPDDVAAVVMPAASLEAPSDGYLEEVREICDREDALLVFDEVLSGFRFATGGAQEYFDVTPDLTALAKGISNGYPLSALVGRGDVMDTIESDGFFYSMTYAGETLSLAASKAAIQVNRDENVPEHIWDVGSTLREGYNDLAADHGLDDVTEAVGMAPRIVSNFEAAGGADANLLQSLFMQECHKRGVLFFSSQLTSYSHSHDDIEETLDVYDEAMGVLAEAVRSEDVEQRLEGPPIGASVRQQMGDD